jgi:putative FmdB family regulatory protein
MPIYGYACKSCGHEFETLVRASDTPACPSCAGENLDQKLSLIAMPAKHGRDAPVCEGGPAGGSPCGMCCGACD